MIVHVTKKHISKGKPANCSMCPIALAMRETLELPKDDTVQVIGLSAYVYSGSAIAVRYALPIKARRFMHEFDGKLPVEPFSFTLRKRAA